MEGKIFISRHTGKPVILVKCKCKCHDPKGPPSMHWMDCCEGGSSTEPGFIEIPYIESPEKEKDSEDKD